MDSKTLNRKIRTICNRPDWCGYEAWPGSGKAVPYIGWFWRNIEFDWRGTKDSYVFGVIPASENELVVPLVGFMENNKWYYDEVVAKGEDWKEIKGLLETAVTDPCAETLGALNDKIQSLIDGKEWFYERSYDPYDEEDGWNV